MGYKRDALKGISWMSAFRMATRGMTFVKTAVLARVLTPSQFGVFGIASLILALLEMLTETGINVILIQSKRNIEEFLDSAWVVSILRGTFISLLLIISSPIIASFFNTSAVLPILLFMSIVPFIRGFINPAIVTYQKELVFRSEFFLRTGVFFFDATVTVIAALITHSVYSLVWGLLAGAILEVILSFILIRPHPRFRLQHEYFKDIFHKGKWMTASGIFAYIAEEGDSFVVGKVLGAPSLGVYQMAYKISMLPISEISNVVSGVVFPVYAKIVHDKNRLWAAFVRTLSYTMIASFALSLLIFLFPKQIVLILLGNNWLAAVPVLQILAVYGFIKGFAGPASALFLAVEKQQYVTTIAFVRFTGLVITIYPMIMMYGLVGAAYSAMISVSLEIPIIIFCLIKIFKKDTPK